MKYSKLIIKKICTFIESDDYTIVEICKNVNISEETFHQWKKTKPEFSESIKKAENKRLELFKTEARKSLAKKLTGYDYEEIKTVYQNKKDKEGNSKPVIKEQTKIKKHVPADTTAIIFTLKNTDPENFKDTHQIEHNINDEKKRVSSLFPTLEELNYDESESDKQKP